MHMHLGTTFDYRAFHVFSTCLPLSLCAVSPHQGEVVDVQYGSADDLRRAKDSLNLTNQIAVVKLGQAPLLYKVRSNQCPAKCCCSAPLIRESHVWFNAVLEMYLIWYYNPAARKKKVHPDWGMRSFYLQNKCKVWQKWFLYNEGIQNCVSKMIATWDLYPEQDLMFCLWPVKHHWLFIIFAVRLSYLTPVSARCKDVWIHLLLAQLYPSYIETSRLHHSPLI